MELTQAIKEYVFEKVDGLEKFFSGVLQADVEVGKTSRHHQKGDVFFCEMNLSVPKTLLRSREEMDDLYKAINKAKDRMQRELKKYKGKLD
jgi:ribosomal subunit interface protein